MDTFYNIVDMIFDLANKEVIADLENILNEFQNDPRVNMKPFKKDSRSEEEIRNLWCVFQWRAKPEALIQSLATKHQMSERTLTTMLRNLFYAKLSGYRIAPYEMEGISQASF